MRQAQVLELARRWNLRRGIIGLALLAALWLWPASIWADDPVPLNPHADWLSGDINFTSSVTWGDVDGDGDLDLAVGNVEPESHV